jgi:hypothetical protein
LIYLIIFHKIHLVIRSTNSELVAAKEKLEIVSGAAPSPFQIFAGGFLVATGGEMRSNYSTPFPPKNAVYYKN